MAGRPRDKHLGTEPGGKAGQQAGRHTSRQAGGKADQHAGRRQVERTKGRQPGGWQISRHEGVQAGMQAYLW